MTMSSAIRLLLTFRNRNPYRDAPEIDYNVAVIFVPSLFLGSNIGLLFSYFLPPLLISMILIVILLYSTYWTLLEGISLWKEETGKARFFTKPPILDDSDSEEGFSDHAEEISMSSISDSEIRQRLAQAKMNTTITTIHETRSSKIKFDLFPLEKIIQNEK